jgi:hypothetical protein
MGMGMGMGMGYDQSQGMLPSFPVDPYQGEVDVRGGHNDDAALAKEYRMREKVDVQDEPQTRNGRKKRRLSSLGFISPSFFEDHMKSARRDSTDFLSQPSAEMPVESHDSDSAHSDGDHEANEDENGNEDDAVSIESFELENSKYSPAEAKSVMEGFASAMEVSQKSQQDIHDWDKKMGLKRSHSKTMRLSARSRKKLRATFKKEINALASKI